MPDLAQVEAHSTRDLDEHVALINRQVLRSLRDGETRQLAVKIVSGQTQEHRDPRTGQSRPMIKAYGQWFEPPPQGPCAPRDERCEVARIWNFVVLNFRYVYDPRDVDTFATARESLKAGGGDCDDATILFSALLESIGFHTKARVISTRNNPNVWVHVYPLVGLPKDNPREWLPLDMTVKGKLPGWQYPSIANQRDFNLGKS